MNVGCLTLTVPDARADISFPTFVLYPCQEASSLTAFGPYTLQVCPDGTPLPGLRPLVVVSHGNSSWHMPYRDLAMHLAGQGYVVAMVEHHGNNRRDNSLANTLQNLELRPRHVSLAIDAVQAHPMLGTVTREQPVAIVGHSLGGYTALAVAGGKPWFAPSMPVEVQADARVRALVLLAPATPWYRPAGALSAVTLPILMYQADQDPYTPRWHGEIVEQGVSDPAQVTSRIVEGAGHYAFLSPFPPSLCVPGFLPAIDPPGFDRARFQLILAREVTSFLSQTLA